MKYPDNKCEVSVIVPTFNRSKLLSYTLDSLVKQKFSKEKFEVVIGDDGSYDDTSAIVDHYKELLNLKYVFQEDKGYRPASARNIAIRLARGKICLFLDAGVIVNTNCIYEHYNFHNKKESKKAAVGLVYGIYHGDESEDLLSDMIIPTDADTSIE